MGISDAIFNVDVSDLETVMFQLTLKLKFLITISLPETEKIGTFPSENR